MSDIRPLEPDMVDLSDSSEDSHREDEREEIMQVEDLDVAGQSKESTRGVHEADPNEIEEIGEPSSQGGGTNVENPLDTFPGRFREMSGRCLGIFHDLFGKFTEHVQDTSRKFP